jgi:hypothetical protein
MSITSRCTLSPSERPVSLAISTGSAVSEGSGASDALRADRRSLRTSPCAASPDLTASIMVAMSSQIAARKLPRPGAVIRSSPNRPARLTSVSMATRSRLVARHSSLRSKRTSAGSRAWRAAACKTLKRTFTRSLADKPCAMRAGSKMSRSPSRSMILDFMSGTCKPGAISARLGGLVIELDHL